MKKISRQLILVLLISLLFSITQNSFAENVTNSAITKINGVVSDYSIVRTNYDKNSKEKDIGIFFPQINGLKDKIKQININKIIKDKVLMDYQDGFTMYDITKYDWYDLDYTIVWSSNKLLSIVFYGNCEIPEAPHPNSFCLTVNIDMSTGNKINFSDVINTNNDFIKLFIDKAQFIDDPVCLTTDELSEVRDDLFNIDNLKYDFGKDSKFYFTSTGVVFSINTFHAIGDYALLSLKFSELSNYIKQNTVWNNIKTDFPSTDYEIIREQCFKTNLTAFGDTWFVSGFNNSLNGVIKEFKFYLIDQNSKVKYTFPNLISNKLGYWGINAVAFRDVNHDGKIDIIIIADVNSETDGDEAGIYLCGNNGFILDNKLNTYINTKQADTVSKVINATQNYYK